MSASANSIPDSYTCISCRANKLCLPQCLDDICPSDMRARIVKQQRLLQRGDYLFRENDDFQEIYAICHGSIKTSLIGSDGILQITGFHITGEILGLDGIEKRKHAINAITLETTTVCVIPYNQLEELSNRENTVMRNLLAVMTSQIDANQNEIMSVVGNRNASGALASFLCALSRRYAANGEQETEFYLPMSRNDISNYLGLAKETISRLFTRFEDDGLIDFYQKQIRLLNLKKLANLAGHPEPSR